MNRSLQNTFAIVALTLACTPTLRCEGAASQAPAKSKLQSAIEYIKNIRTPLTPKETLAQFIAQADVPGFKSTYNSYQKWIPSDRITTLQELAIIAQEVKDQLQVELETNGDKIHKTILVKGAVQTVGLLIIASILSIKSLFIILNGFQPIPTHAYFPETNQFRVVMAYKPFTMKEICIGAGVPLSIMCAYNGFQNCKDGWNYKAYLEKQIASIDEISEFIQAQIKLS